MTGLRMSGRRTTMIGALLTAIGPISMAVYTPAMPELVHAFATTESAVKMTLSVYFGGFALAQLVAGPMSDAFGRRKAALGFLLIYLAGSLIAVLAPSIEWLIAGRLVQGIGASVGVTVSRAMVRDAFVGAEASRIVNAIGIVLAIGPAAAPTIGGLSLAAFGWQSIFCLMVGFGVSSCIVVVLFMRETAIPDRTRARPGRFAKAYFELAAEPRFLAASLVLGGSVGALYAQSTMLPFILIRHVGLSPLQFGMGMLMQTGFYFLGSVALRLVATSIGGHRAVSIGLCLMAAGATMIAMSAQFIEPRFLSIMLPVSFCSFGLAFVIPHITTVGLFPFPHIAGAASALMGFIQMGAGFVAGLCAAKIGEPLAAFGVIIPAMEFTAVLGYLLFLRASRQADIRAARIALQAGE